MTIRKISNSEVQAYRACPRKWWLAWILGYAPKHAELTGVRATGTRLHIALAALYTPNASSYDAQQALKDAQTEDALAALDEQKEALYKAFILEKTMLEGYFDWLAETGVDRELEVIGSEQYLEGELLHEIHIIGKLDARVIDHATGERRFIDHKNVGSFIDRESLRRDQQMKHYELLEWMNTQDPSERSGGAIYNQLKRSKRTARATPPFYQREDIPHNTAEISNYMLGLRNTALDLIGDERYMRAHPASHASTVPPRPSKDCKWMCPFEKHCTMLDDGSRWEEAFDANYTKINPLGYYGGAEKGLEE